MYLGVFSTSVAVVHVEEIVDAPVAGFSPNH
jgi:hypothetical protein